jgi:IS5 family transposase
MVQTGLFDITERYEKLSAGGDALEKILQVVDFEVFRSKIEVALARKEGAQGGRPAYDGVMMFKIFILQALYDLSDDAVEYQIKDRLSFMRFLGLTLSHPVPDAKTVWLYREKLNETGACECLFQVFNEELKRRGYVATSGQIVDATVVSAPKQRNTKTENALIKEGGVPEAWRDQPSKLAQKDTDARWFVKRNKAKPDDTKANPNVDLSIPHFGYKNHVCIDRQHGFIRKYCVTPANVYDGRVLGELLDDENDVKCIWGDTGYRSAKNETLLASQGYASYIHHKKPKNRPLPAEHQVANAQRSSIRAKVEHVFACEKQRLQAFIRTIGIVRARSKLSVLNLVYNLQRLIFLERRRCVA